MLKIGAPHGRGGVFERWLAVFSAESWIVLPLKISQLFRRLSVPESLQATVRRRAHFGHASTLRKITHFLDSTKKP